MDGIPQIDMFVFLDFYRDSKSLTATHGNPNIRPLIFSILALRLCIDAQSRKTILQIGQQRIPAGILMFRTVRSNGSGFKIPVLLVIIRIANRYSSPDRNQKRGPSR